MIRDRKYYQKAVWGVICLFCFTFTVHTLAKDGQIQLNQDSYSLPEENPVKGDVIIFTAPQGNIQMNALLNESVKSMSDTFNSLGRFLPVEKNRAEWAFSRLQTESGVDAYQKMAELLEVDIYIILAVYRRGNVIRAEMKIVPMADEYRYLRSNINIRSYILMNIPLKLSREIAYLHRDSILRADIIKKHGDMFLISAGQWHGIHPGKYKTRNGDTIEIIRTGRYRSLVRLPGSVDKNESVVIDKYPDFKRIVKQIEKRIDYNTGYRYGLGNTLLRGGDPEKRFIQGVCIINMGANICLPGYGSFLSTEYLGIQSKSSSIPGVILSSTLILTHLTLTEFMTGFKTNFFPFVRDSDKSKEINNLQYFLWTTLPLTFTASYLDQLSYQFSRTKHLPPFFFNINETALVISTIIPGGGLFYKGYRLLGWGYYFSEMLIAGFGTYNLGAGKKSIYAFTALGIIKLIEMINAYFINPSYSFYNIEKEREVKRNSFSIGLRQGYNSENLLAFSVIYYF